MTKPFRRPIQDSSFATELAGLRRTIGYTQNEAARRFKWSESKLSRIENALSPVELDDIPMMLGVYQASTGEQEHILAMAARAASSPPHSRPRPRPAADRKLDQVLAELSALRTQVDALTAAMPPRPGRPQNG